MKVLLERRCCVCEVMQALDISQSRASRNLGILQDAGFVRAKRDGLWVVYSIDEPTMNSYVASLAQMLRNSLITDEVISQDKARLRQAVRVGTRRLRK